MYIKRKLEDTILKYLSAPEIIAIIGARQSGKTTLLKKLYSNVEKEAAFLSFEDRRVLSLFEENIDDFISLYAAEKKYLFIDEFQYAKHGGKNLKYIYDLHHIKIFISGSSAIDLTVNALKFLVGRIFIFTLHPFDFEEFLSFKDDRLCKLYKQSRIDLTDLNKNKIPSQAILEEINHLYEEYIVFGGYPRVALANTLEEKKNVLANIYNTYFLREVKDILGLIDDYKLVNLIKALALQSGNLIEYNELGNTSEINYSTLKSYINFLEKTFICKLVRPFYTNKRLEIVKNPKIYFMDTGLLNYITDDFRKLADRPNAGQIIENAVFQKLTDREYQLNYWRTKAKDEIDFILSLGDGKTLALEIKNNYNKIAPIKAIKLFKEKYKAEIAFGYYKGHSDSCKKDFYYTFPISLL